MSARDRGLLDQHNDLYDGIVHCQGWKNGEPRHWAIALSHWFTDWYRNDSVTSWCTLFYSSSCLIDIHLGDVPGRQNLQHTPRLQQWNMVLRVVYSVSDPLFSRPRFDEILRTTGASWQVLFGSYHLSEELVFCTLLRSRRWKLCIPEGTKHLHDWSHECPLWSRRWKLDIHPLCVRVLAVHFVPKCHMKTQWNEINLCFSRFSLIVSQHDQEWLCSFNSVEKRDEDIEREQVSHNFL
jgi:hypothetical protein